MLKSTAIILILGFAISAPFCAAAETVTVNYNDGKADKGELVGQTPDKITLRVTLGGNTADIPIDWTKIKSISNGLTKEAVIVKWKTDNKDKLCPDCNGDKKIQCKSCAGSGLLAHAMVACTACKGAGTIACTAKGCTQGQVTCPGKCLKLSEGKWVKGKDDLMWRNFGTIMYSEHHLGDILEMKDGKLTDVGKCPICGGTTTVSCKVCDGLGTTTCALCKGLKQIPEAGLAKKCPDCNGAKMVACPTCKGTGLKL